LNKVNRYAITEWINNGSIFSAFVWAVLMKTGSLVWDRLASDLAQDNLHSPEATL
jgi:hypothetical protein